MHRVHVIIGTIATALLTIGVGAGAQTASQVVHFSVTPISRATLTESFVTATRGLKGNYELSTNAENTKLTVSLDRPLPSGYSITANATAPEGAESAGHVILGATASDLVSNIPPGTTPPLSFVFTVSAHSGPVVMPGLRRIVFTLTSGV